jgi:hypothetical protein
MRYALALGVALLLTARPALANRAAPPFRPQPPKLVIEVDENAKAARLIIPQRFLGNAPAPPPRRLGQLPTIMVGVALALGLAFSGLWLVRKRGGGAPLLLAAVAIVGLGGATLWANARPIRREPPPQPKPPVGLPLLATLEPIQVETVARGDTIRLIIPPTMKARLAPTPTPAPKPTSKIE